MDSLRSWTPGAAELIRTFFILVTATCSLFYFIPALRRRYTAYGPRANPATVDGREQGTSQGNKPTPVQSARRLGGWSLESIVNYQVPHTYFLHFYIISVFSSCFWAIQILTQGRILTFICQHEIFHRGTASEQTMSVNQIVLMWALMTIQGTRRLYESWTLLKPSESKMWFALWFLGLSFYMVMNIAIWIEGAGTILARNSPLDGIILSAPSIRTMICLPVFILASGIQYDCHTYLASLPKYTLPAHPNFSSLICPHYTAECFIYLTLTILGAPRGSFVNKTMLCAFIFVSANLAATAESSRQWYSQNFGEDKIARKRRMIPWLY